MEILTFTILGFYVADVLALFYFGIHCYIMLYLYLKNSKVCTSVLSTGEPANISRIKSTDLPMVTIQLPVYNEYYVVERLIDSVISLKYPKHKLEIQVLDDSTDNSRELAKNKVSYYRKKGFRIRHITRKIRTGNKAGALKEGLEKAKGEFIAIFDADFIPSSEFLARTIPFFYEDEGIGMVQTRWGHVNEAQSLLTRAQSIGVDGHFMIEQIARNGSNLWMNFNGTAGIWRKKCILDSGNWQSDTLTEDFDLSYRAELKGWRFKYLSDVLCPAELPSTVSAFKSQQFRWCKGSLQTAVKLLPRILRCKEPLKVKLEATTHLLNYSVHPLIFINILLTLPLLYLQNKMLHFPPSWIWGAMLILGLATMGPIIFYAVSQFSLYSNWRSKLKFLPVLSMIGSGVTLNNTKAWLEGVLGKKSDFIRTPKLGLISGKKDPKEMTKQRARYHHPKLDIVVILEVLSIIYLVATIIYSGLIENWYVIPYLLLYLSGFFYVAFYSLSDYFDSIVFYKSREAREAS